MWSHCKFIPTDGTGHDSVNHRFESMLTQFGWETTKEGSLRSRSFQGISSFFWKWIYHVFYHFSRLIHKVLWNPSHPNRCCPGKMGEASRLCASDVTWYHNGREILGEGAKGEVTRSALAAPALCSLSFSPSSLTCQCSPSSKACLEHIEVQVLSSPFQWCSIQFCDEVDCREYHESKYQGKRS